MNADRLLALYDRLADAPDAVPRLRRFVLDLAVRGKLVEQDPVNEPASELLKRIASEKSRLMKAGKLRRQNLADFGTPNNLGFDLPSGWTVARFSNVLIELQTGPFGSSLHQSDYEVGGTPVINPASIQDGKIVPIEKMAVGEITLERLSRFKLQAGDIVMGRRGEMGRCAVVTEHQDGWLCGTGSLILRLPEGLYPKYLAMLINSPYVREYLARSAVGATMRNLNQSILLRMSFAVPPFAEQQRIIAKVNELMVLCDRLEETRTVREDTRDWLTKASYASLSIPDADNVTFQTHARFVVDALPALTARADQVKRLRQAIFDLAVRGKLMGQEPAGEPASELVKRIAEEKSRLKVRHHVKPLSTGEIPFSLPVGWLWSRIGELCTKTGSGSTPRGGKNVYKKAGVPFLRSQNVYDDGLRLDDVACIEPDVHARMAGTAVRSRDLLLNITGGSMGRCCRVPDEFGEANVSQHVAIIRPAVSEMADFLQKLVLSPYFQTLIFDEQTGAGRGGLPKYKMDRIPVAVPPVAEQRRIVAKVDELMTQCDRMKASLDTVDTGRHRLLESLLREALEPAGIDMEASE